MSLKPKKKSDAKKITAKMKARESRMGTKEYLPPYTLIVSEGVKTEPLYLEGFVRRINERYKDIAKESHIVVYGTGRNTSGLIRFVDRMIQKGGWNRYHKVWLVYDKDDFPLDHFDNTQFEAEARNNPKMAVAWSNESIELWFLLHFQDYYANNGREHYIQLLHTYFAYSKTREDLYDILMKKGSLVDAKRRAKRLYQEFLDAQISNPSAMVPATRMFELVEELERYL